MANKEYGIFQSASSSLDVEDSRKHLACELTTDEDETPIIMFEVSIFFFNIYYQYQILV